MSEPIKAGDLVIVIHPTTCCGNWKRVGEVHLVQQDNDRHLFAQCTLCGTIKEHSPETTVKIINTYCDRSRLKRIPPLSELEGERTQEDIREPA